MYNKQILSFTKYRWFLFSSTKKEIYRQRIPADLQLRRPTRKTLNLHTPESKLVTVNIQSLLLLKQSTPLPDED